MVRYADSPTATVERSVDASPGTVWELVSDGPAVGARFRGHNHHEVVGDWSVVCTVTALEPERAFEWTVGPVDDRAACWRFDLVPDGEGVLLRFTAVMGPGPSGLTPAILARPDREEAIVERRLREWTANMERTVAGIAAIAEAGGRPGVRDPGR